MLSKLSWLNAIICPPKISLRTFLATRSLTPATLPQSFPLEPIIRRPNIAILATQSPSPVERLSSPSKSRVCLPGSFVLSLNTLGGGCAGLHIGLRLERLRHLVFEPPGAFQQNEFGLGVRRIELTKESSGSG
jgi:hypothetical protein